MVKQRKQKENNNQTQKFSSANNQKRIPFIDKTNQYAFVSLKVIDLDATVKKKKNVPDKQGKNNKKPTINIYKSSPDPVVRLEVIDIDAMIKKKKSLPDKQEKSNRLTSNVKSPTRLSSEVRKTRSAGLSTPPKSKNGKSVEKNTSPVKRIIKKPKTNELISSPDERSVQNKSVDNNKSPVKTTTSKSPTFILTKIRTKRNIYENKSTPDKTSPIKRKRQSKTSPNISNGSTTRKSSQKKSDPYDVFEFNFDPNEEEKRVLHKKRKKQVDSDTSGDDDNSMKIIMKQLRKHDKKTIKQKPQNKRIKQLKKNERVPLTKELAIILDKIDYAQKKQSDLHYNIPDISTQVLKSKESIPIAQNNSNVVVPNETNDSVNIPDDIEDSFMEDLPDESPSRINIISDIQICKPNSNDSANIVDDLINSFIEDQSDEIPPRINKISDISGSNLSNGNNKNIIFNSTRNSSLDDSHAWRLNFSTIRKNPHNFAVKKSTSTPAYTPEIFTPDILKSSPPKKITNEIEVQKTVPEKEKVTHQTSILNFIKPSTPKSPMKALNISSDDDEISFLSPRKILAPLNYQSTPVPKYAVRNLDNFLSATVTNENILKSKNALSPKKNPQKNDSLFGFSLLSDNESFDENKEYLPIRKSPRKQKENVPTKKSPKKQKKNALIESQNLSTIVENDATKTIESVNENNSEIREDLTRSEIDFPSENLSIGLFQDLEVSKKTHKHYTRKHPKRVRRISYYSSESEDENLQEKHYRKKIKDVPTKEENEEAGRLATHYNSMFQEIEKYSLIIE